MIDRVKKSECVLCKACSNACLKDCITYSDNYYSFDYPSINMDKCINCSLCEKVCPALKDVEQITPIAFYASKNKSDDVLKISSSGGIFYPLAKFIINNGGYVCGASFDDDFDVKHVIINDENDIYRLCGSKYVQSDINTCYKQIKDLLKEGKTVLFSGCSCQTAGLYHYLGGNTANLLLVDFICHGIVSANVFSEYKSYLENKYNSKIIDFQFRNKDNGWLVSGPKVQFENGSVYTSPLFKDPYMQGYFKNLNLKEACHTCKSKNFNSKSDLTLGDYWSAKEDEPEFYEYMGTSVTVVNTSYGEKVLNSISTDIDLLPITLDAILACNESLVKPFPMSEKREEYFATVKKQGYIPPLVKMLKAPFHKKVINKIKRLLP